MSALAKAKAKELLAGLEGVTEGPWDYCKGSGRHKAPAEPCSCGYIFGDSGEVYLFKAQRLDDDVDPIAMDDVRKRNIEHVARCSPENIRLICEAIEAQAADLERVRKALIETGRNLGADLGDNVSNDFLMLVPEEARLVTKAREAAESALSEMKAERDAANAALSIKKLGVDPYTAILAAKNMACEIANEHKARAIAAESALSERTRALDTLIARLKIHAAHARGERHMKAAYAMEDAIAALSAPNQGGQDA